MKGGMDVPEGYITLEQAAELEGIQYKTLAQRLRRNPESYDTITSSRPGGGKDQVLIAVTSLTAKARKAYEAGRKAETDGREIIIGKRANQVPWYVEADLNEYIENNRTRYYEAVELARRIQGFLDYDGEDRTEFGARVAEGLGISLATLYRQSQNLLTAQAWALKLEKEDGQSRDYFRVLALCRKPKQGATFPSLPPEQRAVIENIWFDKAFAANLGTREMLYEKLTEVAAARGWDSIPSAKTVGRYITYLMERPGAESARYLAANGLREWKNKRMIKTKRDTTSLKVMEYVVGDEHTFDFWVSWTAPNGKVRAVRPKLVAWEDMRSRCIVGDVICVNANSQTLKESLVKMIYSNPGGVPYIIHVDNGKDYTSQSMTGQSRKERKIEFDLDSETVGFYQSIGVQEVGRSLPYQPWDKPIERFFGTVCQKFSKWFESYTGTLTGSKTYAKRQKDVAGMLERGELLTLEEFYDVWTEWKNTKYHTREHRGLKAAGEPWTTPIEVFERAERYEKAAPPREFAAMLLMKATTALVTNQGIHRFGVLYTDYELSRYVGQKVGIKWDIDDVTKLYVFDSKGQKICEAVSAEVLAFGQHCSQAALEKHLRKQKQQERDAREFLAGMTTPYEARLEEGRPSDAVGKIDLTVKAERPVKVVQLPVDKEYRGEMAARPQRKKAGDEFLASKASDALARIRAIGE